MGELASRLVQQIAGARTVEDFDDAIWIAGDLLKKSRMSNHRSHFDAVNRELVTDSTAVRFKETVAKNEAEQLQIVD